MTKPSSNAPPYIVEMQAILADNVRELLRARYPTLKSENALLKAISQKQGVKRVTVQRILHYSKPGTSVPGLDKVAYIARALGVTVIDLLTSNYAARSRCPDPEQPRKAGSG